MNAYFLLLAVLMASCPTNGHLLSKLARVIVRDIENQYNHDLSPGEPIPNDIRLCLGDFEIISNCGMGTYQSCDGASTGIFDQSWSAPGPAGATTASYLLCEWVGSADAGFCEPKPDGVDNNYCHIPVPVSASPSPSKAASVSRAASPTSSASVSSSPTDLWAACLALATEGYNRIPVKIEDVQSVSINSRTHYSVNLKDFFCDPESNPLTFTVEGNIPEGVHLSGSILSGTPTTPGHYQIRAMAWDGNNPPSPSSSWWIDVLA